MVNEGEVLYSKYFDITENLLIEMSANNLDLESGKEYTVEVTVAMNSGLTATSTYDFNVEWEDNEYAPNAEIAIDYDDLTASIRPYCEYYPPVFYKVEHDTTRNEYVRTDEVIDEIEGMSVEDAYTTEDDMVFSATVDGTEILFCIRDPEEGTIAEGVLLSVYRRQYDGTFMEIATGIDHTIGTFVTDPHPALDYARYRIVATTTATGSVSYYDVPGVPVDEPAVIIQWNETWTEFNTSIDDELEEPTWAGSLLKLPYNIDISDKHSSDVSLVEYIGRSHPVSYYGTQLGETATWNVEVPKEDKDTLYALRRLAIWMGDVYVREPSGSGYWANISVSFSQKHCEVTIPVTLEIARVEGGM